MVITLCNRHCGQDYFSCVAHARVYFPVAVYTCAQLWILPPVLSAIRCPTGQPALFGGWLATIHATHTPRWSQWLQQATAEPKTYVNRCSCNDMPVLGACVCNRSFLIEQGKVQGREGTGFRVFGGAARNAGERHRPHPLPAQESAAHPRAQGRTHTV